MMDGEIKLNKYRESKMLSAKIILRCSFFFKNGNVIRAISASSIQNQYLF